MKVLVDSSVWVGHFKQRNEDLVDLLEAGLVVTHPYVVVELACGTPPRRRGLIRWLRDLESAPVAAPDELLALIESRSLYGRGCGFVDIGLLASALLGAQILIWTQDKRLAAAAVELGCCWAPALP